MLSVSANSCNQKIKTDEKQALYYEVPNANLVDTVRTKSAPL